MSGAFLICGLLVGGLFCLASPALGVFIFVIFLFLAIGTTTERPVTPAQRNLEWEQRREQLRREADDRGDIVP